MMDSLHTRFRKNTGVTLVELVVVMVLVGILGAIVAQLVYPVFAYIDSNRRAALADVADTALRRMGRDLRLALPNSVRVTTVGGVTYLEFLLVRTGGRYRTATGGGSAAACGGAITSSTAGDLLTFGTAQTCFSSIGAVLNLSQIVANSDRVVVFNLQPGTTSADAYQQTGVANNNSLVSGAFAGTGAGAGQDQINFASNTFTYASPGNRFFIVQYPVTYACDTTAHTLTRYWNYTIPAGGGPVDAAVYRRQQRPAGERRDQLHADLQHDCLAGSGARDDVPAAHDAKLLGEQRERHPHLRSPREQRAMTERVQRHRQQGSLLIAALFLIVGLGILIGYLSLVSSSSQTASIADLNSSRAYQTARTGAEWGIYQVMRNSGGSFASQCLAGTATPRNQTYGGTLAAFTATISCTSTTLTEGGGTVVAYAIQSNACNVPAVSGACPNTTATSPLYVERQVNLTVVCATPGSC